MRTLVAFSLVLGFWQSPQAPDAAPIRNFLRISTDFCTGGQPKPEQFAQLKAQGVKAVLNLRTATEYRMDDEVQAVKAAGMKYFNIPVVYSTPTDAEADEFLKITDDPSNRPMFIHCTAAIRAGAFWMIRRIERDHWTWDAALAEAQKVGLVNAPHLEEFVKQYVASHPPAGSAAPAAEGEWTGKILTGMVAVGGESTGMMIETPTGRLELLADGALKTAIEGLKGQQAMIRGTLETRAGVEVPVRKIIHVSSVVKK